jgi:hypothetical protein
MTIGLVGVGTGVGVGVLVGVAVGLDVGVMVTFGALFAAMVLFCSREDSTNPTIAPAIMISTITRPIIPNTTFNIISGTLRFFSVDGSEVGLGVKAAIVGSGL